MKGRFIGFTMLLIIFVIVGGNKLSEERRLAKSTWAKVANKEFSNLDSWAGTGLYFYEEDGEKYCVYMIYGSGVPVIYHYESKAEISAGIIRISLPINIEEGALNENFDDNEVKEIELVIEDDRAIMGDMKFIYREGQNSLRLYLKVMSGSGH